MVGGPLHSGSNKAPIPYSPANVNATAYTLTKRRCYIGWKRLKEVLDSDKIKQYKFIVKPRFLPYLINETLDEKPVKKADLFDSKFMGK